LQLPVAEQSLYHQTKQKPNNKKIFKMKNNKMNAAVKVEITKKVSFFVAILSCVLMAVNF